MRRWRVPIPAVLLLLAVTASAACSLRKIAISKIGDALAEGGTTFASDDDPELVAQALPFSLKMVESLLAQAPEHRGLLLAAASGYTQYAYAFVQQDADRLADEDFERASTGHARAARLYLRARDYGLRGLDAAHPHFSASLRESPDKAVAMLATQDVPLVYWTGAAWGAAIALSKTNPDIVADQPIVEALMDRALALDEAFAAGAIHGFLITYEPARQGAGGDFAERSRLHFERAVELSGGHLASPYVALAESVCVPRQDRAGYERLLQTALAVDPDERVEWRLANLVTQKRARWLLSRADRVFAGEEAGEEPPVSMMVPHPWQEPR